MLFENFTPISSFLGGLLLGGGALLLMLSLGRIAGISGIVAGLLSPQPGDLLWRLLFVFGLLAGTWLAIPFGHRLPQLPEYSYSLLIVAGLLVGVGTRIGRGCTSGHGICGLGPYSACGVHFNCSYMNTTMSVSTALAFQADDSH